MANSTSVHKTFCNKTPDNIISIHPAASNNTDLTIRKRSITISEETNSTSNDITTTQGVVMENNISPNSISISSANAVDSKKETSYLKGSPSKSSEKKKWVAIRKVNAKKVTKPIKTIANNGTWNSAVAIEKILKQIKMTKYQQYFKKMDMTKFKNLNELDLNAVGITRPTEIKIFMDAVKNVK